MAAAPPDAAVAQSHSNHDSLTGTASSQFVHSILVSVSMSVFLCVVVKEGALSLTHLAPIAHPLH